MITGIYSKIIEAIDGGDNEAFRKAAANGHLSVIECLLAKKADGSYEFPKIVNNRNLLKETLDTTIANGHGAIANKLLELPNVFTRVQRTSLTHENDIRSFVNQYIPKIFGNARF